MSRWLHVLRPCHVMLTLLCQCDVSHICSGDIRYLGCLDGKDIGSNKCHGVLEWDQVQQTCETVQKPCEAVLQHNAACQVVPLTYLLLLLLSGLVSSHFQLHFASSVLGSFHGMWTLEGKGRLLERILTHHPWSALTHSMTPDCLCSRQLQLPSKMCYSTAF